MADKSFGVKELNILGSGTPSIDSQGDLNLNANKVAISTNFTVGGASTVTGNSFVGSAISMYQATGIVSATKFCGDGSALTGISAGGFTPDADKNLLAGDNAGENLDGSNGCFNIFIGQCTGKEVTSGCNNLFFGADAGRCITTAKDNISMGCRAGRNNTGDGNIHLGHKAGYGVTMGSCDIMIGSEAGCGSSYSEFCCNSCNIYIGRSAGKNVANTGEGRVFIGSYAGACSTSNCAVAIGCGALTSKGCSGQDHLVAIGWLALNSLQGGNRTVAIGDGTGNSTTSGSQNFFGGYMAGANNTTGSYNTFIGGNRAGCYNHTGQYNTYIGNLAGRCGCNNSCSTIMGASAGYYSTGGCNTFIGAGVAANSGVSGCFNALLGFEAGCCMGASMDSNVFLGAKAGHTQTSGDCNIAIGKDVTLASTSSGNQLAIGAGSNRWLTGDSSYNIKPGVGILDCDGATGSSGQVLSSTGTYVKWTAAGGGGSGGCLKLVADRNYISDGSCSGCNFSGATDNIILGTCAGQDQTSGDKNVFIGCQAGRNSTTGYENIFMGMYAGCGDSGGLTGANNVAIGCKAGCGLSSGGGNVLLGYRAAPQLSTGSDNIIMGFAAYNLTTHNHNVIMGYAAGNSVSNHYNIAIGAYAGKCVGEHNIAMGWAGGYKQTGNRNIFIGADTACRTAGSGGYNVAVGMQALNYLEGRCNTAFGYASGCAITTGCDNVTIGYGAGCNITTGSDNVAIGKNTCVASATGNTQLAIGVEASYWLTGDSSYHIQPGAGIRDKDGDLGTSGQVLSSTGTQLNWIDAGGGGGGSGGCLKLDADLNLYSDGTCSGCNFDGTNACGNLLLGQCAGKAITTGGCNIALGFCALATNTVGYCNIAIGAHAGANSMPNATCTGQENIFIGHRAGYNANTSQYSCANIAIGACAGYKAAYNCNVFMGNNAGKCNANFSNLFIGQDAGCAMTGHYNIMFGRAAGKTAGGGGCNIGMGFCALYAVTGCDNVGIGACDTLKNVTSGHHNIGLGKCAGGAINTGCCNIAIGCLAGFNITSGDGNVAIGIGVSVASATGDNQFIIGNLTNHWICGDSSYNIYDKDGNQLNGGGGGSGGCLKLIADGNYISDGSCSGCSSTFSDTDDNILIGRCAGKNTGTSTGGCAGHSNIFLGKNAGFANTTGCYNISMGFESSYNNDCGHYNVVMGYKALRGLTQYSFGPYGCNVVLGYCAGGANYSGNGYLHDSVFIGANAGRQVGSVEWSTAVGCEAFCTGGGNHVAAFGASALKCGGDQAIGIGGYAGCIGSHPGSIFIGMCSGYCMASSGSCCNIIIGHGRPDCHGSMANWCGRDVILIGNSIQPPLTGGNCPTQLGIGVTTNYWITGDSSFNIKPGRGITDCDGATGTSGQVLSSTGGAYVKWVAASGGGGGSGGCLKLLADRNYVSDGSCSGCNVSGATDNIFLGSCAGKCNTGGDYNVYLGGYTGQCATTSGCNVAIGMLAGRKIAGAGNVMMGRNAMGAAAHSGSYSVVLGGENFGGSSVSTNGCQISIGYYANYYSGGSACKSIAIGTRALMCNWGDRNIALGENALSSKTGSGVGSTSLTGSNNVAIGPEYALYAVTSGLENIAIGQRTGMCVTSGCYNISLGCMAGSGDAGSNYGTGNDNVSIGNKAGSQLSSGADNVFLGKSSGLVNTTGNCNVAIGHHALLDNTTASYNTAVGHCAGASVKTATGNAYFGACAGKCTEGSDNTFIGLNAGKYNHSSNGNIAIGRQSSANNSGGGCNTVIGNYADHSGSFSCHNVILGYYAAHNNGESNCNVYIGACAAKCTCTGNNNVAIGRCAGFNICQGDNNVFLGSQAGNTITSGCCNIAIGYDVELSSATGNNQLAIGSGTSRWLSGDSSYHIQPGAGIRDKDGDLGTSGQVLSSTGTQLNWIDAGGGGGGSGGCLKIVETTNLVSDGVCAGCNITSSGEDNILLGRCAGRCITQGDDNVIIGQQAGNCLVCGSANVYIGKCAGYGTTISGCSGGNNNVVIGMGAGKCGNDGNFSANVFIGCEAARTACYNSITAVGSRAAYSLPGTNGWMNTVLGACAGYCSASGQSNTFVGSRAGKFNASGSYNAFFGFEAMGESDSGGHNTVLGVRAGRCITGGESGNTFVGKYAARCSTQGSNNVAIGCDIQLPSATGDNQMAIGIGANKWIYGDSSYNIYDKDGNQLNGGGGAGFSPDSQGNLYAGTSAGACSDSDTLCNIAIGECAGCKLDAGDFNVILGNNAGRNTTTGKTNFFGGYSAGCANVSGCYNVMFGLGAGKCPTAGNSRVLIGQGAGEKSCGNFNAFIGYYAGQCAGTGGVGSYNVAFGYNAGKVITTGNNNVLLGCNAGCNSTGASHNVVLGTNAGRNITTNGSCNIIAGYETGCANTTGCYNVYFGKQAGKTDQTGYRNVYIGATAGRLQASGRHDNVFLGNGAGRYSTSTNNSVFIGCYAGIKASGSDNSVFIGTKAGAGCSDGSTCATGDNTIAIGMCAGLNLTSGGANIFLGMCAGDSVTTGGSNVVIGPNADVASATGSAQLVIGCGSSNWITGDSSYNVVIGGCVQATSAASSANGHRKITTSTSAPSGGADGDIWIKYTA